MSTGMKRKKNVISNKNGNPRCNGNFNKRFEYYKNQIFAFFFLRVYNSNYSYTLITRQY